MNYDNGVETAGYRAGFVAIIGEPNVGKSTLLNTLIGAKISIVTDKPQTTRHKIVGIVTRSDAQIVCFDTPGLLTPRYMLHEVMMNTVRAAVHDVDVVCLVLDAKKSLTGIESAPDPAFSLPASIAKPVYLLINKIDIVRKADLLPLIAVLAATYPFKEVFPVSALRADGTNELLDALAREMPEHPPYYPSDMLSEQSERFFVGEIIREKIFELFYEEIPYSTTVDIIDFQEHAGKKDLIRAEIYVERDSQKGMLVGKGGGALKSVGELARRDIESFLGRPVFLELFVKVRKEWKANESWLKRLGYTK